MGWYQAGTHKTPLLGWHPPAGLAAWARAEAQRRGGRGALSDLLTEALLVYKDLAEGDGVILREALAAAYQRERAAG